MPKKIINYRVLISLCLIVVSIYALLPIQASAYTNTQDIVAKKSTEEDKAPTPRATTYSVAFDPDDGVTTYNGFYKTTVNSGSIITDIPPDPTRNGYAFAGWSAYEDIDGNPVLWNFDTDIVTANTTLWAAWKKWCTVAFDPDDGVTTYGDFYKSTVLEGTTVKDTAPKPTRDGFVFIGWSAYEDTDEKQIPWDFSSDIINDNTTLWPIWKISYNVTFNPDDGVTLYNDFYNTSVLKGDIIKNMPSNPTRSGYVFLGWYADKDSNGNPVPWDFENNIINDNTTLLAIWKKGCLVTFNPMDGVTPSNQFYKKIVPQGDMFRDLPENPKRQGYEFKGWYSYKNGLGFPVLWDFSNKPIDKDTIFFAYWIKNKEHKESEINDNIDSYIMNNDITSHKLDTTKQNTTQIQAKAPEQENEQTGPVKKETVPKTGHSNILIIVYVSVAILSIVLAKKFIK